MLVVSIVFREKNKQTPKSSPFQGEGSILFLTVFEFLPLTISQADGPPKSLEKNTSFFHF
jgi:hypothetical protein